MKQLTCEMCGSTELIKQDGVFVCQTCGCKYSVEEARKMMIEGTVEITGTVKVDNTAQVNNFLELSQNAYSSGNGQSAFDYANKALEITPRNPQAWICKMKSIEYMGTLGNLRLMEVIEAGKNAVNFASDEEKDTITYQVYKYELIRALKLLKLAMNKMSDSADIKRTFQQFAVISVFTATQNTLTADSKVVSIYDGVANEAIAMVELVPDAVLCNNRELANLVGECAKQYQYVTNALIERYKIYGATLLDSASSARISTRRALQEKSEKAIRTFETIKVKEKRAAVEKQVAEYWAEHVQEKERLDNELSQLNKEIENLNAKIKEIEDNNFEKINLLQKERGKKLDCEIEIEKQRKLICELESQRDKCGIFKGKEKKALQERIDTQEFPKLEQLKKQAESEKKAHTKSVNAEITAIKNEGKEFYSEVAALQKRRDEINAELTRDR